MATNTASNIGIRINFPTFGDRNFENSGSVQYVANREPLEFLGTSYHAGDTLTFDVAGTSYSKAALQALEQAWDQGWIKPLI